MRFLRRWISTTVVKWTTLSLLQVFWTVQFTGISVFWRKSSRNWTRTRTANWTKTTCPKSCTLTPCPTARSTSRAWLTRQTWTAMAKSTTKSSWPYWGKKPELSLSSTSDYINTLASELPPRQRMILYLEYESIMSWALCMLHIGINRDKYLLIRYELIDKIGRWRKDTLVSEM